MIQRLVLGRFLGFVGFIAAAQDFHVLQECFVFIVWHCSVPFLSTHTKQIANRAGLCSKGPADFVDVFVGKHVPIFAELICLEDESILDAFDVAWSARDEARDGLPVDLDATGDGKGCIRLTGDFCRPGFAVRAGTAENLDQLTKPAGGMD